MSKLAHNDDHDQGLAHLQLLTRRRVLWFLGGAALVPVIASCTQITSSDVGADAATGDSYLRGVQVTDANGQVSFTKILPACYSGRWPHIRARRIQSTVRFR